MNGCRMIGERQTGSVLFPGSQGDVVGHRCRGKYGRIGVLQTTCQCLGGDPKLVEQAFEPSQWQKRLGEKSIAVSDTCVGASHDTGDIIIDEEGNTGQSLAISSDPT